MRYVVNAKKRTVVAIIDGCKFDLVRYVNKYLPSKYGISPEELFLDEKYIGIAKCSPTDIFNEKVGKVLAARRAQRKYEKDRTGKMLKCCTEIFDNLDSALHDQYERYNVAVDKVHEIEKENK